MAVNTNYGIGNAYGAYANAGATRGKAEANKASKTEDIKEGSTTKKTGNYGKTIGDVKLSDEAAKYYEQLKKQYGNMDFILVSKDQKANAQANAARFANPNKTVVLIDEEKIERMATDEKYRKQYEGIIKNAASGLSQLKEKMEASGQSSNVLGYGMKVNDDGTANFFAVLKKSSDSQKARIEEKAEQKKADKKAAEKKAAKKDREEQLKEARLEHGKSSRIKEEDTVTIEAKSMDELFQKISDYNFNFLSDNVETEAEIMVGHNIDFKG